MHITANQSLASSATIAAFVSSASTPQRSNQQNQAGASLQQAKENESSSSKQSNELSPEEEKQVQKLKARDREVRAHEQAHKSAAGGLASGASYEYETGPDGRQYAVAGEVKIDTSPVLGNPEATARKARQIQKAATAPAEPSSQDLQVAAQALAMEQQANLEKNRQQAKERQGDEEDSFSISAQPIEELHKKHSHTLQDKDDLDISLLENKANEACTLCGGKHSAESHTELNQQKLNKILESTQEIFERASVFSIQA